MCGDEQWGAVAFNFRTQEKLGEKGRGTHSEPSAKAGTLELPPLQALCLFEPVSPSKEREGPSGFPGFLGAFAPVIIGERNLKLGFSLGWSAQVGLCGCARLYSVSTSVYLMCAKHGAKCLMPSFIHSFIPEPGFWLCVCVCVCVCVVGSHGEWSVTSC